MIYTHHAELHAAYPGTFSPCEVIVNGDLGGGNRPSIAQIDAQLGDPGSKINRKLARARDTASLILIDYEDLPWRLEVVADYREPVMHLLRQVRLRCSGNRLSVYGLPLRFDLDTYGAAQAKRGVKWYADRILQYAKGKASRSRIAAQLNRSYGDTPRMGVADLADAISPVCYQGRPYNRNRPDLYPAADVLPPVLGQIGSRPAVPIVWAFGQDFDGRIAPADPAEARAICGVIRDHGLRDVVLWMHDAGDLDDPQVRAVTDIYVEAFA